MFERFSRDARTAVTASHQEAARLHHESVGAEHLLLALLGTDGPGGRVLREHGFDPAGVRTSIAAMQPGGEVLDPEALAMLGIDLDEVRHAVEEAFGPGALDPPPRGGHVKFSGDAKKALELALRHAIRLKHRSIDTGHLLLGVLHVNSARVTMLLRERDVTAETLRHEVTELISAPSS